MPIHTRAATLVLALCCAAAAPATHAGQVFYGLDFTVEYVFSGGGFDLDPRVAIGNVYTGSFSVDSAVLAQDAIDVAAEVGAFSITMEDVSWVMGSPFSAFAGFRGPGGFGASPGFDVAGGQVTNLRGGVFGSADFPFVDFSTDVRLPPATNTGACTGANCGNRPNAFYTVNPLGAFGGAMTVHAVAAPVPEPESFAMLFAGVVLVGLGRAVRQPPLRRASR
jgi:hypothetical protein